MITVQMRNQNIPQPPWPQSCSAKLHLRALAAIKEKDFALPNHGRAGKIALIDWRRRAGAEENDFEHEMNNKRISANGQENFEAIFFLFLGPEFCKIFNHEYAILLIKYCVILKTHLASDI